MLALALSFTGAAARAAMVASVLKSPEQALAQAAAHGQTAAALYAQAQALSRKIRALEQEIARLAAQRAPLATRRAQLAATLAAVRREREHWQAQRESLKPLWRRYAAALAAERRRPTHTKRLDRAMALLTILESRRREIETVLAGIEEAWRHTLRLAAWDQLALAGLPAALAALSAQRAQSEAEQVQLFIERSLRLRRQIAALRQAARLADLAQTAHLALTLTALKVPLGCKPPPFARISVRALPPLSQRTWAVAVRGPASRLARVAPILLDPLPAARRLPVSLPLGARLIHGFGDKRAGPLARGLTFSVPIPAILRALRPGKVVFAAPFGDFGPLLILDHGGGYHTLIAGLDRIDVNVGAEVESGATIGRLAAAPARPRRLYLELRHYGEPIDPLPWLALRQSGKAGSG